MEIRKLTTRISSYPWRELEDAHKKKCIYIPDALQGIISDNKDVRDKSYWKLDNHIIVQSGLSEGAFFVLPFVIELYKSDKVDGAFKYELFNLLFEIANGVSDESISYNINFDNGFEYYTKGTNYKNQNLRIACRSSVLNHFNFFMTDLFDLKSKTRKYSLELLGSFIEHLSIIHYKLEILLKSEKDPEIIKGIHEALRGFNEITGGVVDFLDYSD